MYVHMPDICYNYSEFDMSQVSNITMARSARLDIRTTDAAKATIEDAANFLGITTSAFILESAVEKATLILQRAQSIHLNESESKHFLDVLENPPKPSKNLRKLFDKHSSKKSK